MAKTTRFLHLLICLFCIAVLFSSSVADARPRPRAPAQNPRYAMLIMDAQTGRIMDQENADRPLAPASLTKLMTLFMVFEAIQQGKLSLSSNLVITPNAQRQPPSKLNLRLNEKITVDQAIHVLVTRSANDVAMALAETVGGSNANFTRMMTQRAHSLGMKNSYFYNPHGLPNPNQKSSARDMAILARALMQYFPQHYHVFKTIRFNYKGQTIETHNNLMRRFKGMDGLKTGYTVASGFNLVASAVRNNRRVIVVVFGGRSAYSRDEHVAGLMNKALAQLTRGEMSTQVASVTPPPIARPVTPPVAVTRTVTNTTNTTVSPSTSQAAARDAQLATTSTTTIETRQPTATNDRGGWRPDGGAVRPLGTPAQAAPRTTSYYQPAAPAPAANRNWGIQVGAFSNQALSQQTIQTAQARLRGHAIEGQPTIVPSTTASGTIYRARIVGLTAQNATKACQVLQDCMAFSTR